MIIIRNKENKSIVYLVTHKVMTRSIINSLRQFATKNQYRIEEAAHRIKDFDDSIFNHDYIFTFVRNPYDRFLSSYFYAKEFYKNENKDYNINKFLIDLENCDLKNIRPGADVFKTKSNFLPKKYEKNKIIMISLAIPLTSYIEKNNEINSKINIYKIEMINDWMNVRSSFLTLFASEPSPLEHINKTKNRVKTLLTSEQKGRSLAKELSDAGIPVATIDGDSFRSEHNNHDFSDKGRIANLTKAAKLAAENEQQGEIVILSFIAPQREWRNMMRKFWKESRLVYLPGGTLWEGTTYERPKNDEY